MKHPLLLKTYIIFSFIYLGILLLGLDYFASFMKPFLIPILILSVCYRKSFPTKKTLLLALLFSWIGDVILIFTDQGEMYFIFGLVAFLISHLVYISLFLKQEKKSINLKSYLFKIGIVALLFYFILMLGLLLPKLGPLKIPVIVYAVVITAMLFFALKGCFLWIKPASSYIFAGAVVFVCSDSILAFNKFHTPLPNASFFIMITYILAQYLITLGITKLNREQ
jgi:uncharacterized membrane protein YhhN